MTQPDPPLPDCLTRLLGPPAPVAGRRARRPASDPDARPRDRATDGAIIRASVYGTAGLVWVGVLWQVLHRLAG